MTLFIFFIYTAILIYKYRLYFKMTVKFIYDTNNGFQKEISKIVHEYFGMHCFHMFINNTHKFLKNLMLYEQLKISSKLPLNIIFNILKYRSKYIHDYDTLNYFNHPFNLECIKQNNYNIPSFCFVGFKKFKNDPNNEIEKATQILNKYNKTCIVDNDKYVLYYIHRYENDKCTEFDYNDILNKEHPYYEFYQYLILYIQLSINNISGKFILSSINNSFGKNYDINNNIIFYTYKYGWGKGIPFDTIYNQMMIQKTIKC